MANENEILMEDCCRYYSIETSFVQTLFDQGLVRLEYHDESYFIHHDQLALLEKYMHLHYDLEINMEGIEAISHLLKKIEHLQAALRQQKIR
ncbi:chaperone modulator CbpM [Niabella insulamsoli]|uniref:chaperone modulator CbpM n=1 Tax=Niabella insulamsoli TaxID=3144874 RepID=UPI0031FDFFA7